MAERDFVQAAIFEASEFTPGSFLNVSQTVGDTPAGNDVMGVPAVHVYDLRTSRDMAVFGPPAIGAEMNSPGVGNYLLAYVAPSYEPGATTYGDLLGYVLLAPFKPGGKGLVFDEIVVRDKLPRTGIEMTQPQYREVIGALLATTINDRRVRPHTPMTVYSATPSDTGARAIESLGFSRVLPAPGQKQRFFAYAGNVAANLGFLGHNLAIPS